METDIQIRTKELQPYIAYIRDYDKLISLSDAEYQKEFSDIKKGALLSLRHSSNEQKANKETEINFDEVIEKIMSGEKYLSYSALSAFLKSPRHYREYVTDRKVTKAMEEGKRFHMACLEPDKFEQAYWVLDDTYKCIEIGGAKPRSTKIYKEWVIEQESNHSGERISKDEYDTYMRMSNALRFNKATKDLMSGLVDVESKFIYEHDEFKFIGFIDGRGNDYTLDLKKVADASFRRVKWDIKDRNYDLQGALYSTANQTSKHWLIFIDTSCNITVVKLLEETLSTGWEKLEFALTKFVECSESGGWYGSYEFYNGGYINV